jgi:hypothetical protein
MPLKGEVMDSFTTNSPFEEINSAIPAARRSPYFWWLSRAHQQALQLGEGGPCAQIQALNAWQVLKNNVTVRSIMKLDRERVKAVAKYRSSLPGLSPQGQGHLRVRIPLKAASEYLGEVRDAIEALKQLAQSPQESRPHGRFNSTAALQRAESNRSHKDRVHASRQ